MAKRSVQRSRASAPRLFPRILLVVVLVAAVAAGAVAAYAEWLIRQGEEAAAGAGGELDAAVRAQELADSQRLEELALAAARLAGHPALLPALRGRPGAAAAEASEEAGPPPPVAALEEALDRHSLELVVVRGAAGEPVLRAGATEEAALALAGSELVARAAAEGRARGAWPFAGRLYLAAAARVERDFEPLGTVAVAGPVDRATALLARALGRAEAVYLAGAADGGATPVATTLGREAGGELLAALEGSPPGTGPLPAALRQGERPAPVELRLGGRPYRAVVVPLADASGRPVAARVTLAPAGAEAGLLRAVQAAALAGGVAALLLGLAAAPLAARGAARPLREVTAAAEAARADDLEKAARRDLPAPLAAYFADAAEKRALEEAVASAAREARAPLRDRSAERRRGAVLVVEMPRYGHLGRDEEPRDVAERLARDLVRVRRAIAARGGRVEAALGHRVLASFDGERSAPRGAGAAAELLRVLAEPENAFDEPLPPALALATGELVLGGPEGARTVAGLPVQQAEGLLREASSGDLILSRSAYRELEGELAAAGVEVAPQRGLLTAQPVYLFDAERSARAAAALGTGEAGRDAGLAALGPGAVLADRFVLAQRLAAGRTSMVFLAHDRQSDSPVAIKALRRELVADLDALEAPEGGLRRALQVVHPAVARVIELGVSGGVPFVAGELVDGPSLARVQARVQARGRSLAAPAALRLGRGLAAGLAAIHEAGLAHGDLRPETVILDPRGHARLIDLGVAPVLFPPGVDPAADRALGSPRYLAPERLAGGPPTAAADVYAAGALLAEAFTGRPLYGSGAGPADAESSWDDERERIAAGAPELPDPTELPDGLAPVLARCLAREPEARYAGGGELAAALAPIRAELVSA